MNTAKQRRSSLVKALNDHLLDKSEKLASFDNGIALAANNISFFQVTFKARLPIPIIIDILNKIVEQYLKIGRMSRFACKGLTNAISVVGVLDRKS